MEENDIISLITGDGSGIAKAIEKLRESEKNSTVIDNYRKEVYGLDRKIRATQVGNIIKDKVIGKGESRKLVKKVKVKIPFAKKIIRTATAFEFGKPVSITPNQENQLSTRVLEEWDNLRMDSKLQELTIYKKTETESCIVFNLTNRDEKRDRERKIKATVYSSKHGKMIPYLDSDGDMRYFMWCFKETVNEKVVNYYWIYDEENIYQISDSNGTYVLDETVVHGFNKIPVVYVCQDDVEYFDVKEMIDRYEVSLSKLGNANDYSGHPLLFLQGKVEGMPDKDEEGKVLQTEMKIEDGKEYKGDAKFLTHDNAPQAVQLELDTLEELIYSMSSTPDVSFSNLKGIGNIASHSMELMFLDAKMKALLNEGDNRTTVQRCLSVISSAITTTMETALSSESNNSSFDIKFESILPSSLSDMITSLTTAVTGRIVSPQTAVKQLNLVDDYEEEVLRIQQQGQQNNEIIE